MKRELWLLRHAKAKRDLPVDDFDRPLKKRGKQAATQVGEWLKTQHLIPDVILSSPAKRAADTAILVYTALDKVTPPILFDERLYFHGADALKSVLAEYPTAPQRVLLVGHNPDLEDLLAYLIRAEDSPLPLQESPCLATATLAKIKMPNDWSTLEMGCARLLGLVHGKSLPDENV